MHSRGATRNSEIDGLRGYLAAGVVLHHFYIAWEFEISGQWVAPDNVVFRHLGTVAVSFFFMITAYLFYGKILSSQGKLDWRRLYVGRVWRLWPMYAVSVAILLLIVATHTNFDTHESYQQLAWEVLDWLAFTIPAAPDVNGYTDTASIVAGVTWTLRYEWLFYAILPFGALLIRHFQPRAGWRIYTLIMLATVIVILPEIIVSEFNTRPCIALHFWCARTGTRQSKFDPEVQFKNDCQFSCCDSPIGFPAATFPEPAFHIDGIDHNGVYARRFGSRHFRRLDTSNQSKNRRCNLQHLFASRDHTAQHFSSFDGMWCEPLVAMGLVSATC